MEFLTLNQAMPRIDDFFFRALTRPNNADAIVICNPSDAICRAPVVLHSKKSLEDHVKHIQEHNLKKAVVIAEDISFLKQCPSLEYLWIIPALETVEFDFSPVYSLPNLRWLQCETVFGPHNERFACIDYSQVQHIERLAISGNKGHENIASLKKLKVLYMEQGQPCRDSLIDTFDGEMLEKLVICQAPIKSLDGLKQAQNLRILDLAYNKKLEDITALSTINESLRWLSIEQCGKISDFSVLSELKNLEFLQLIGSNTLPNLQFIRNMPKLKSFIFKMNNSDGDMSMCLKIPYVSIRNKKHYSHKDKDFLKCGNSESFDIEAEY
jgi:hypothetical protein